MIKIKYPWDIEEEKDEEKTSVIKFDWDKPTPVVPTQFGIGAKAEMGITLPESEQITEPIDLGIYGKFESEKWIPEGVPEELQSTAQSYIKSNANAWGMWFKELQSTPDKMKFLKGENWSPELEAISEEAESLGKKASELGINPNDWIKTGVYAGFFSTLAATIYPVVKGLPAEILNNLSYKVEGKTVKGRELMQALRRVRYPEAPGIGEPSILDKKIFAKFVEEGGVKSLAERMKGITITEITPRFAFGGKLYAGIPIDEMVKSIISAGKLTQDIVNQLKVMNPVDTALVLQQLSVASPAIASELASQFVELMPQKITKIPKAGEEMTPEEAEAFERLKKEEIVPIEEVEPTKIELEEIEKVPTSKEKFMAKMEEIKKAKIDLKWEEELPPVELGFGRAPQNVFFKQEGKRYAKYKGYVIEDTGMKAAISPIRYDIHDKSFQMVKTTGTIEDAIAYVDKKTIALEKVEAPEKIMQDLAEKVEVKPEEPKIDLATPAQIKKAHTIANTKALISEKGKMKPQYRKIAEVFTGKRSVKDMTPEEAEMFIDQLDRLPEPKYKAGKLIAPSIPRTMKLTTLDFFKKKYGEPTPVWLLTDQTYYATKLGIKPLVEPFEKGKMKFDLEFRQSSYLVDRMVNKLNTIAKTSVFAKIKSKVKNVPTKAETKMAELINKHEATPSGLTEKEEDVFKYFRNLSKDIWRRENEVREKVDLPPIKYKTAYFRHTADVMAKEMLEGKYPFPQGIKYWGEKMVGKKIFNPMEFHRKLSDDLIDLWSKDIRAVTKAMLWSGLKEIYLAQPAKFLNEQLNAISKDLPEYKNLSSRDQAAYDQTRVMPSSTKKWLINYVNQVLKGQETELDASLNRIVTKSGLKGIFDKVLSPFGRSVGRKPITNIFMLSGRAVISGVMGWVPRQIMRNSFQPVQNLALYGIKATIKAYLPASVDKNLKELMSESLFLKSYTGFEELPTNLMGKVEKVWLGPYGIVAVNNAKLGMKAAYWNIIELIRNPKFRKHGWADSQRTKDIPKGFLYPSEKEKLSKEMEFGASATQYQYIPMGMPGVFRYKALVPLTRLQSWWMNYFSKFTREAIHRALRGRPSWSGEGGPTLPWSRRVNWLKYVIIGGAILTSLGYKKSFMLGVLPVYMSPAMQVALGMYNYATADKDWKRKKALKQIYYSWKAFIPGSLAWRDFLAVWNGEKELSEILWYGKKEKAKGKPVPTVKFDWDKTTKPKKIIKFNW